MLFKRKFAAVSAVLAIFILISSIGGVSAQTVGGLKGEISKLEQQSKEINEKTDALSKNINDADQLKKSYQEEISNVEEQISTCEKYISAYNNEITSLQNDISAKEKKMSDQKILLKQRVRSIFMYGKNSLTIIAGNNGFTDYLSKEAVSKSVSSFDKSLIDEINKNIKEIEAKKKEIENKKSEISSAQSVLEAKQKELYDKENSVNSKLSALAAKNSKLNAELLKIQQQKASYEDEITRILQEEARRENEKNNNGNKGNNGNSGNGGNSGNNGGNSGNDNNSSTGLIWPVPTHHWVSSGYGWRPNPFTNTGREFHTGIDIAGSGVAGKPAIAALGGTVKIAGFNNYGWGNYVVISHGYRDGHYFTTHYAHLKSIAVSVGQTVKQGQTVGYIGKTGQATGNHLHFEIRLDGHHTNPRNYV